MASEIDTLIQWAKLQGYTVGTTKNSHLRFISPQGYTVFGSSTPSDRRAIANIRGKLRRQLAKEVTDANQ